MKRICNTEVFYVILQNRPKGIINTLNIYFLNISPPIPVAARSTTACLLGLRVRIPPGARMPIVSVVLRCRLEVPATGRSLVQRSPTECGVFN